MIKQIKLLTILGSAAILGGVSTFAILGTSCGNGGGSTSGSIVILPPSLEVGQIIMSTVLVSTTPFDHNLSSEISGEYITFEDGAFFEVWIKNGATYRVIYNAPDSENILVTYLGGVVDDHATTGGTGYSFDGDTLTLTFDTPKLVSAINYAVFNEFYMGVFSNFTVYTK